MNFLFELQNVSFTYPGGIVALRDLSLRISDRRKVAFLGCNGSGKSTLFLNLVGLLRPQQGTIFFRGEPVRYHRSFLRELRRRVGIVFQDPDTQLFAGSVFQEISFGPLNLALSREEVRRRVEKALSLMALGTVRDRPIHFLSYGEKRRVAIADILAMEVEVILCDEPTAYLDARGVTDLLMILEELYQGGKEILFATHDVNFAYALADWVVVLQDGAVLAEGSPEVVLADISRLSKGKLCRPLLLEVTEVLREQGYIQGEAPRRVEALLEALRKGVGSA